MAGEAGVDEAGRRVGEQAEPAERALALQPGGDVVGQGDDLVRRAEHELAGVQDERLVAVRLDQPGQLGLLDRRVDVRVAVVLEHPEVAVDPHVDAGRLHHGRVVRIERDPAGRRSRRGCPGPRAARGRPYRRRPRTRDPVKALTCPTVSSPRGCSSMAEHQLPKLTVRVRFSSPAPRGLLRMRGDFAECLGAPVDRQGAPSGTGAVARCGTPTLVSAVGGAAPVIPQQNPLDLSASSESLNTPPRGSRND